MKKSFLLVSLLLATTSSVWAQPKIPGMSMSVKENLYWPIFKQGKRSQKVRVLQGLLNINGAHLALDSYFGRSTQNAVSRFQKSAGIKADGVVGSQTWEKLIVPLSRGARGPRVREIQHLLSINGYPVKADGIFGATTESAIRSYQKKEGGEVMVADGRAHRWVWCWLLGGLNISD